MDDLRNFFRHQLRRIVGLGALGCLVHLPLSAQTPLEMPVRLDRFHVFSNGNIVSNQYASAFEAEGIRLAQHQRVFGKPAPGGVSLSKQLAINTKNGIVVAEATQKIAARQMARTLGGLLGGPVGLAILAAPTVLSWLEEGDLQVQDGQIVRQTGIPDGYDGYEYREQNATGTTWYKTRQAACVAHAANTYGGPSSYYTCLGPSPSNWMYFQVQLRNTSNGSVINTQDRLYNRRVDPSPPQPVYEPVPYADLEQALENTNPSPDVLKRLGDAGGQPDPAPSDPARVENPQPSPEKTSITTNADGSTETTVCRTNATAQGNSIKLSEQCTITMRSPTGTVIDTKTTTSDNADPVGGPQGQGEQSLFCQLFPKVLACAEFGTPQDAEIPKLERNVSYVEENLFGGGSCPADTSITSHGQTLTIGHWSMWCGYVTTYVRPIALLLAAFTALTIVALGKVE